MCLKLSRCLLRVRFGPSQRYAHPHIAVKDAENIPERRFEVILENARRFAAGDRLRNVVNKAGWY